jgi:hypothetical protein
MRPERVRDLFARQLCSDIASVGTAHPIEDCVEPQSWLDDDNILVVFSDVTASGTAAGP